MENSARNLNKSQDAQPGAKSALRPSHLSSGKDYTPRSVSAHHPKPPGTPNHNGPKEPNPKS